VEEQLLKIKFDWPVQLANGYRDPHPMASNELLVVADDLNPITTSSTGSMLVVADDLLGQHNAVVST
jgi:hypothetical protein